jgi:segregation and condensation protein A
MARRRRVDLKAISMVELVSACLEQIETLTRVEEKADQLLLAADLVAMKARLLIGDDAAREDEEEALRNQVLKLERIQRVATLLMERDQLGCEIWPRGAPEIERDEAQVEAGEVSILDVVRAYARLRLRDEVDASVELRRILAMTLREALEALCQRVDELDEWTELFAWAGKSARGQGVSARSQAAASFVAALEMAKRGEVEIVQDEVMGDLHCRKIEGAT